MKKSETVKSQTSSHRLFAMAFAKVYPLYVQKAQRRNRTQADVDEIIRWLTGYSQTALLEHIERATDIETFFTKAPRPHANRELIKGLVCGVRVEEMSDPLMKFVRQLDKLIDELAKGMSMEKILR